MLLGEQVVSAELCLQEFLDGREGVPCSDRAGD